MQTGHTGAVSTGGMRPGTDDLAAAYGQTIPDLVGAGVKLLIVGINPGLWSGATGAHFARPGNRFWPALCQAGITDRLIDLAEGYAPGDREYLIGRGLGITNLVTRATARADELAASELREGVARLEGVIAEYSPRVVAVAGITAYRTAFRRPRAAAGPQLERIGPAELWVVPNPSGLNAHETAASLAVAYGAAAAAAGII